MDLAICIGSSCHLKGSKKVAMTFERLISEHEVRDKINYYATFCLGNCQKGVCVSIDKQIFSVTPEIAEEFFEKEVLSRIEK